MRLDDAQSLAGLLEHLLPWAGELRAAMYHFYYLSSAILTIDGSLVRCRSVLDRINELRCHGHGS